MRTLRLPLNWKVGTGSKPNPLLCFEFGRYCYPATVWARDWQANRCRPPPLKIGQSIVHFEGCNKRLLRDLDLPKLAHPLLAGFLLLQQLLLPRGVAAIALGGHVFAHG